MGVLLLVDERGQPEGFRILASDAAEQAMLEGPARQAWRALSDALAEQRLCAA